MLISADGLVIRETKVGDFDKMITLLTKEYGLISVAAKGSKNLKSKLMSGTQSFSFGTFILYSAKGKYSINDVDQKHSFFNLQRSLDTLALGSYICELASVLAPEGEDSGNLLSLTLNALHVLENALHPNKLIKAVYELRSLSQSGFAPNLVACNGCSVYESEKTYFSHSEGLIWCKNCFEKLENPPADCTELSSELLYALRYIVFSEDKKIFSFRMNEEGLDALTEICEKYTLTRLERSFNTLDFYNTVKN